MGSACCRRVRSDTTSTIFLRSKFTLITDNKPLQYIFNPSKLIQKVVSAILARWAITQMVYNYDVQYTPGQDIGHADAMSRLRFKDYGDDLIAVALSTFEKPVIDDEKSREEVQSNEITKRMMNKIRNGNWKNFTKMEQRFYKCFKCPNHTWCKTNTDYQPKTSDWKFPRRPSTTQCFSEEKLGEKNACLLFLDNEIKQFVKNCPECTKNRPRFYRQMGKTAYGLALWSRTR